MVSGKFLRICEKAGTEGGLSIRVPQAAMCGGLILKRKFGFKCTFLCKRRKYNKDSLGKAKDKLTISKKKTELEIQSENW